MSCPDGKTRDVCQRLAGSGVTRYSPAVEENRRRIIERVLSWKGYKPVPDREAFQYLIAVKTVRRPGEPPETRPVLLAGNGSDRISLQMYREAMAEARRLGYKGRVEIIGAALNVVDHQVRFIQVGYSYLLPYRPPLPEIAAPAPPDSELAGFRYRVAGYPDPVQIRIAFCQHIQEAQTEYETAAEACESAKRRTAVLNTRLETARRALTAAIRDFFGFDPEINTPEALAGADRDLWLVCGQAVPPAHCTDRRTADELFNRIAARMPDAAREQLRPEAMALTFQPDQIAHDTLERALQAGERVEEAALLRFPDLIARFGL